MKKAVYILGLSYLAICFVGCVSFFRPTIHRNHRALFQALPPYAGPKACIAVPDFEIRAAKATNEIGQGLRQMLIEALVSSNRFLVVSPPILSAPKQQETSGIGFNQQEKVLERNEVRQADLILSVSIVEFYPQASGGRAGIGGGGGVDSGILGGLLGTSLNKAHLALDMRINDALTSKSITQISHLKGQASDFSSITIGGSLLGNIVLDKNLAAYNHTPMEKAIRICIIEAVRYIIQNIPPTYYEIIERGIKNGKT